MKLSVRWLPHGLRRVSVGPDHAGVFESGHLPESMIEEHLADNTGLDWRRDVKRLLLPHELQPGYQRKKAQGRQDVP